MPGRLSFTTLSDIGVSLCALRSHDGKTWFFWVRIWVIFQIRDSPFDLVMGNEFQII